MKSADALVLAVVVVLLILVVAWYEHRRGAPASAQSGFCAGPHNIGLYDWPYKNYPTYEGRGATWWDGDRRCAAYCQQSPCTVWCR